MSECQLINAHGQGLPLGQAVLDVVESRIDEHARVIPSSRLDTDGLMNHTVLAEVLVCDGDGMFAHQSDHATVSTPDDILHGWAVDFRDSLLLLDIVEDDGGS